MKLAGDDENLLAEINVTPLVDVMLVLLIIFMVTAPLIQQGIAVNLPKSEAAAPLPKEERDVILTISRNKKIVIDRYEVKIDQLKSKLQTLFRDRREKKIFIKADSSVEYGAVIEIMGMIKASGIDRIGMVTDMGFSPDKTSGKPPR